MTLDLHHDLALLTTASQARHAPRRQRHRLGGGGCISVGFICAYLRASAVEIRSSRSLGFREVERVGLGRIDIFGDDIQLAEDLAEISPTLSLKFSGGASGRICPINEPAVLKGFPAVLHLILVHLGIALGNFGVSGSRILHIISPASYRCRYELLHNIPVFF